ncbi:5351_t:CDS:2 [Gigaspora margarita]|uniref:5351_t:CDS:1 n=1 Tax=Gigaspora margarita TaxID=4874 RepID=A0ABN7VL16_GIGMA|nr:5351_t:CDS:2 [Gigaspora margarita]
MVQTRRFKTRSNPSTELIEQKDTLIDSDLFDSLQQTSTSSSNLQQNVNKPSSLCTLPPETFLQICKNLSPADLLSLSKTCKLFYNDLCCEDSLTIQDIWRQSRYSFMPYRKLVPPEGMSERQYVRFLLENKCHICGRKSKSTKIYWERKLRCCAGCLETRMIRCDNYKIDSQDVEPIILQILHCRWDRNGTRVYWKDQITEKIKEIESLSQTERVEWGEQQYKKFKLNERELNRRNIEDNCARRQQRYDRKKIIDEKLNEMISETNKNGSPIWIRAYLEKCSSLSKAYTYNRPFTERSWKILKQKLVREYNEMLDADDSEEIDFICGEYLSDLDSNNSEDKN